MARTLLVGGRTKAVCLSVCQEYHQVPGHRGAAAADRRRNLHLSGAHVGRSTDTTNGVLVYCTARQSNSGVGFFYCPLPNYFLLTVHFATPSTSHSRPRRVSRAVARGSRVLGDAVGSSQLARRAFLAESGRSPNQPATPGECSLGCSAPTR